MDISNGPGIRVSLFTQGCPHHCPGCFNPETWTLDGGKNFTSKEEDLIIALCKEEHCSGLSILGGEPLLERNKEALTRLMKRVKDECPGKTIWLWTGFLLPDVIMEFKEVLYFCDTVIDGPFKEERKDLALFYAGSTNQHMYVKEGDSFRLKSMPYASTNRQ